MTGSAGLQRWPFGSAAGRLRRPSSARCRYWPARGSARGVRLQASSRSARSFRNTRYSAIVMGSRAMA